MSKAELDRIPRERRHRRQSLCSHSW